MRGIASISSRPDGDAKQDNYCKEPKVADEKQPEPRIHSFVEVTQGRYDGLIGSYEKRQGDNALVRTRDHKSDLPAVVVVPVEHIKQSDHTGGR